MNYACVWFHIRPRGLDVDRFVLIKFVNGGRMTTDQWPNYIRNWPLRPIFKANLLHIFAPGNSLLVHYKCFKGKNFCQLLLPSHQLRVRYSIVKSHHAVNFLAILLPLKPLLLLASNHFDLLPIPDHKQPSQTILLAFYKSCEPPPNVKFLNNQEQICQARVRHNFQKFKGARLFEILGAQEAQIKRAEPNPYGS